MQKVKDFLEILKDFWSSNTTEIIYVFTVSYIVISIALFVITFKKSGVIKSLLLLVVSAVLFYLLFYFVLGVDVVDQVADYFSNVISKAGKTLAPQTLK